MVRIGEISAYWQKPNVASVVEVDSPAAERMIRQDFPWNHPVFVRRWKGESAVGELSRSGRHPFTNHGEDLF